MDTQYQTGKIGKRGFIWTIVIIVVAIILLKVWFGFDIFKWLNQPEVKEILMKLRDALVMIWEKYLAAAIKDFFVSFKQFITQYI